MCVCRVPLHRRCVRRTLATGVAEQWLSVRPLASEPPAAVPGHRWTAAGAAGGAEVSQEKAEQLVGPRRPPRDGGGRGEGGTSCDEAENLVETSAARPLARCGAGGSSARAGAPQAELEGRVLRSARVPHHTGRAVVPVRGGAAAALMRSRRLGGCPDSARDVRHWGVCLCHWSLVSQLRAGKAAGVCAVRGLVVRGRERAVGAGLTSGGPAAAALRFGLCRSAGLGGRRREAPASR